MTDPRGLEQPQGPGWWLASDGRWYPPETRTTPEPATPPAAPSAAAVPEAAAAEPVTPPAGGPPAPDWWQASDGNWYPPETRPGATTAGATATLIAPVTPPKADKPRRRPSPLGLAAIAVFVVGLALGIVGWVAGGPDEKGREERRELISAERTRLQATEARAEDAEAGLDAVLAQTEAYRTDVEAILTTSADACSCSEETTAAFDAVLAGIDTLVADPSQANADAVDAVAENRLNPELDRLWLLQDDIRAMMADRAPLPGS
jgi:hypothetical protein